MNIHTASGYAKHGYRIFRSDWADLSFPNVVTRSIYVVKEKDDSYSFMSDEGHYIILTVEDCLADDWQVNVDCS